MSLTSEQEYRMALAEMKARGLSRPEKKEVKKATWPVGENGYFLKYDGSLYVPTERQGDFIYSNAQYSAYLGARGSGKALDITTEIPSLDGWKTMEDIEIGDVLFDEKGIETKVTSISPIMYGHKCYKVTFSDKSKIIADAEHLWLVRTLSSLKKNGGYDKNLNNCDIFTTEEIAKNKLMIGNNYIYHIDICNPVEYDEKDLLLHPYLLGAWLGDGSSREAKIAIHEDDIEIINKIKKLGYPVHSLSEYCSWSLSNIPGNKSDIQVKLRKLGVLNNKHVPDIYLQSSKVQRIELLRGLMDTDGTVSKRGHCSFDSSNYKLACQVRELIASLGIKSTLRKFYSYCNNKKHEYFKVAFTSRYVVFSLHRKLSRQKTDEVRSDVLRRSIINIEEVKSIPVKCIRVDTPSCLFLVTRSFIPTHNTAAGAQKALNKIKEGLSGAVLNPDF